MGVVAALVILTALMLSAAGFDVNRALEALVSGALGSADAITSGTLVRATPLILTGLAVAVAFQAGVFNIGAEGQFLMGATATATVALRTGAWPSAIVLPAALLAGAVAGAAWAWIAAELRTRFHVLEVISTLLLSFVAESLVSLMVQGPLQESQHIYPQSDPIAASARLPLLPGTRLHAGFILAVVAAVGLWYLFRRTLWGFRLRAVGAGPRAAALSGGIDAERMGAVALLGSGALAGLAGGVEVSGVSYALFQNLSPGYGFTAIAVAILARLHPLGVLATGILFGALEAGAGAMQRDAGVPAVAVYVVEAVVILVVLLAEAAARRATVERAGR